MSPRLQSNLFFSTIFFTFLTIIFTGANANKHDYRVTDTKPEGVKIDQDGKVVRRTEGLPIANHLPEDIIGINTEQLTTLFPQTICESSDDVTSNLKTCSLQNEDIKSVTLFKEQVVAVTYALSTDSYPNAIKAPLYLNRWLGIPMKGDNRFTWLYKLDDKQYVKAIYSSADKSMSVNAIGFN